MLNLSADQTSIIVGFLAIFHVVGAVALGTALRGIWQAIRAQEAPVLGHVFLIVLWGTFGCVPMLFGMQRGVALWVLPVQFSVWVIPFVIALFFGPQAMKALQVLFSLNTGLMVLGIVFILIGGGSAYILLGMGVGLGGSLLVGGVFALIGLGIFLVGMFTFFRPNSSM